MSHGYTNVQLEVQSPHVQYTKDEVISNYRYETTQILNKTDGKLVVTPATTKYTFKTQIRVPRVGLMMVGLGGNNGTTLTAGVIANKEGITWNSKQGVQSPDWVGSITQASTLRVGTAADGSEVYVPLNKVVPMVNPNELVIGGWDINSANLAVAMERAEVLPYELQKSLYSHMAKITPLPSVYEPDFIASNQSDRADHLIAGTKQEQLEQLRRDIRNFKSANDLGSVIVLWTANTERYADIVPGMNDTANNLLESIKRGEKEISPSTLFAVASILEGCPYVNGSPQNTFVPGVLELASSKGVFIGGDDLKTGQTKLKSVLVDFLVSAGLKPTSIVSYNHLGNNDGKNLSEHRQFRSKEISKSNVVDDMVGSNGLLYGPKEKPDHVVVIKYVPYVGDSKRAMDEYTSRIFMGGHNTLVIHNTCEDSLLAAPIILDLCILTELMTRVQFKTEESEHWESFHSVLSILSYLLKAPCVPDGTPVVNSLYRQRACIENVLRALVGLPPDNSMLLEHKARHIAPSIIRADSPVSIVNH